MSTEANVGNFFASSASAAVGASSNPANFGHRVCAWYLYFYHDLPVTPINPGSATISALEKDHPTVPSVAALPNPKQTSITEAKELRILSAWLQPGSFDDDVLKFANEQGGFNAVVAGDDGRRRLKAAGKL
ncbi:uncharacterized protein FOBCDRAFT_246359 [Fusarium oxysporum Fo47]|uniref:uncharacterized protein n=1 Tax=Fusarium oxysporum Fo47 TaxID=660027 RepID=UPI002869E859|nr:uncharacterized protein FOBCDRAFT_246359 [Fusarium oxysporum Fo47]QKD63149.2 hypothetical protein FOBCDRAFT_246359 [Fusarium oxysporum Fo47]